MTRASLLPKKAISEPCPTPHHHADVVPSVFIIDADPSARESLRLFILTLRLSASTFRNAEDFLDRSDAAVHGCIISDMRLSGMSGLELQELLLYSSRTTPFIFISAHATTQLVVRAMRNGAVGFLDKPFPEDELWLGVRAALTRDLRARHERSHANQLRASFAKLTKQEQNILSFIDAGLTNKDMAMRLDISVRTVESRRRQLFQKTGAESLPELIKRHAEFVRLTRDSPRVAS